MIEIKKDIIFNKEYSLALDYYKVDAAKNTIVYIHGGGWFRGDKSLEEDVGLKFANAGFNVVIPNYRLAPKYQYPSAQMDMNNLIDWLMNKNFDINHLAIVGASVGGTMAFELSMKYKLPIVSLSGTFDIDNWLETHKSVKPEQNTDSKLKKNKDGANDPFYKYYILNYLGDQNKAEELTPYHRITKNIGRIFLLNSVSEFVPVSGILKITEKMLDYNLPIKTLFVSGNRHAKKYLDEVFDEILIFISDSLP